MYILIWKDLDGYNRERFEDKDNLAQTLLRLLRKEYSNEYDTEVISLVKGDIIGFGYHRNNTEKVEEIVIAGKIQIRNNFDSIKIEESDMSCPVCSCDAGEIDGETSVKVGNKYTSLTLYQCSECGREFCT
jgi:hypothetical protein